jgi:hypothetical protein
VTISAPIPPHPLPSPSASCTELTRPAKDGTKISVNDIVIKAAAGALREVPTVNSTWKDGVASVSPTVDISVAVATPTGLITPIVTRADGRTVEDVNATVQASCVCVVCVCVCMCVCVCVCVCVCTELTVGLALFPLIIPNATHNPDGAGACRQGEERHAQARRVPGRLVHVRSLCMLLSLPH